MVNEETEKKTVLSSTEQSEVMNGRCTTHKVNTANPFFSV